MNGPISRFPLIVLGLMAWFSKPLSGADRIEFEQTGHRRTVFGEVLVEAEDGGVLLRDRNQVLWAIQPEDMKDREKLPGQLDLFTRKELKQSLLTELPEGFRIHETAHYIICYNTTTAYARWCGALYERLYRAFTNYWQRRGIQLEDAPPLVAIVFNNRASYAKYGEQELGAAIDSILGYYSYRTNRIVMYDLLEGRYRNNGNQATMRLNQLLRKERTVATIIHEATHQLAFNCGLHQRYADVPLWLSEGMAIYFETPDFKSAKGWSTIGSVNQVRLQQFREYLPRRPNDSLLTLIMSDDRFRDPQSATPAYAESWAFCYYLIVQHPDAFATYLKLMQQKTPLAETDADQRINDFRAAFGTSPAELEEGFLKAVQKLK